MIPILNVKLRCPKIKLPTFFTASSTSKSDTLKRERENIG